MKFLYFLILSFLVLSACRKRVLSGEGPLVFSLDTLSFDTVFTDMGTATRKLKVYNPYNYAITLNRVQLYGGSGSDFRLNIDGLNRTQAEDIEIPANDSIYLFANVRIDPNNGDAMRWDSIGFWVGDQEQRVILSAYGWNAEYIGQIGYLTRVVNSRVRLTAGKPYVIFGLLAIDSFSVLEIAPGAQIFMYGGATAGTYERATLYIGDNSTLECGIGGSAQQRVEFKTHRLEEDYQPLPFHHGGIYLSRFSRDNRIEHTIIRNALDGVYVDSLSINGNPKLRIKQSLIYNVERSGILGREASIEAENVVIANSNNFNLALIKGGNQSFKHCTFANVSTTVFVRRNEAVLSLRDYEIVYDANGNEIAVSADGYSRFQNCVVYGNRSEEIEVLRAQGSTANLDFAFDYCLVRVDTFSQNLNNCLLNQDPLFRDANAYAYGPDSTRSPLVDAGFNYNVLQDVEGQSRDQNPDIGAYEWQH